MGIHREATATHRRGPRGGVLAAVAACLLGSALPAGAMGHYAGSEPIPAPRPLAEGETGIAIHCAKILAVDDANRVLNRGTILVRNDKIEYVGARRDTPAGYEVLDVPQAWAFPGFIDLHSHIVGTGDINDMVMPVNPMLSTRPSYRPSNPAMRLACASGVTMIFGIPGSGTSISGFGGLYKTKTDSDYRDSTFKDPAGMKSAYNFNPQRGNGDLGASWCGLSWTVERINDLALGALRQKRDDPALENLERVHTGELPVLIHCASAEGVAGTVRMWKIKYDTNCIVSHGSWDGHKAGYFAAEHGVPVNHGPRVMNFTSMVREGRMVGGAQSYMDQGVPDFSLNTDAPVVPQEELFLQGAMSARLGADSYQMVRALTANPAKSFRIYDRVGSLEAGKDATLVLSSGDPLDPRSRVEFVLIDGEVQYSRARDGQWF